MEIFIDNLARCQCSEGHSPVVFAPTVRKQDNTLDVPYSVSRFSRPSSKRFGVEQILLPLMAQHKRHSFELIHCHDAYPCGHIGYLFSKMTGVPYVITSHGGDLVETSSGVVRSVRRTKKIRNAFAQARAICAISNDMKSKILALGAPEDKVHLIHNGVHINEFATARPYSDRKKAYSPYLVFLGRLVESKGVDILLHAFKRISADFPKLSLKVAGEGKSEKDLKSLTRDLGLENRVDYLGVVSGLDKTHLLQNALACISPTLKEAFGIVNIEALAAGAPVIASRVGGIPDIIEDGVNGLLFPPGDVDALYDCIVKLLTEETLAEDLACNAKPSAEVFDWKVIANNYSQLYYKCLEENPSV